ncbi:MAG: REP-associated tyrosine transposase [Deltaproteobacteria bacterium]
MRNAPRRRRTRLDRSLYAQAGTVCSVTFCVDDRIRIFSDPAVAQAAVDALTRHAGETRTPIHAYCVMPDHVHLVLSPSPDCDIIEFVGQVKNLIQRAAWRKGISEAFWQPGFWDHFLRQDEQLETVIHYVLQNPVRAGIVERWEDYPFSGSLVHELGVRGTQSGGGGGAPPPPPLVALMGSSPPWAASTGGRPSRGRGRSRS